jgi:leucyl-tRNA---protein transferase
MNPQVLYLGGTNLDRVLSRGWYRGGNHVFTTDYIYYDQNVEAGYYPVYWLRYDLSRLQFSKTMRRLEQNSERFTVDLLLFEYNEEYELLYAQHALQTTFTSSESLKSYLSGDFGHANVTQLSVFDTRAITIRDQGKLIATGITDIGEKSMSGICNFYDPTYKKYSLGKMLVALKLRVALQNNMQYFYPGYIAPGIGSFDYKTFVGSACIEVWDSTLQEWEPMNEFVFTRQVIR